MRYRLSGPSAHKIWTSLALAAWLVSSGPLSGGVPAGADPRPETWAKPVPSAILPNWFQVDEALYRSQQPDRKGFEEVQKRGIRTVVNLRAGHSDAKLVEGLGLKLVEIPMAAESITEQQVLWALKAIQDSPKPVLIHCQHGADRAGVVSAAYRVLFHGWSKEEAIAELKKGGFGFHRWYVNIPAFIRSMNVARMKSALSGSGPLPQPLGAIPLRSAAAGL